MTQNNMYLDFSSTGENYLMTPLGLAGTHRRLISKFSLNQTKARCLQSNKGLEQCLEQLHYKKVQQAFNKLKNFAEMHKKKDYGGFLPGQLKRNRGQAPSELIRKCRRQSVESYIQLRCKGKIPYYRIIYLLTQVLIKLITSKKVLALKKMKEAQSGGQPKDILEQTTQGIKTAKKMNLKHLPSFFQTSRSKCSRKLTLTYIKVKANPQTSKVIFTSNRSSVHEAAVFNVNKFLSYQKQRQYRYSSEDPKWRKAKINHEK